MLASRAVEALVKSTFVYIHSSLALQDDEAGAIALKAIKTAK
jgi:hypothetical protein